MAERSLALRVSLKDYEKVQQGLLALGASGHRALARIEADGQKASRSLKLIENANNSAERAMRRFAATAASALSAREVIRMADSYTLMEGRLRLVTKSSEQLAALQGRLFRLAQENRAGLEETVTIYTRLAQSSDQLGVSQNQLIELTDTVLKALRVSGATTQEAAAGVIQLGQALASGTLRGDEFRSVLENMPRVARALEQSLGATRGELIKMAKDGQLTSQQVAAALLSQSRTIQEEFGKLPKTVGESLTQLGNSLTQFTGQNGAAQAAVRGLADALSWLSRQIDEINARVNSTMKFTQIDVVRDLLNRETRDLETTVKLGPDAFGSRAEFDRMMRDRLAMIEQYTKRLRELENRGVRGTEEYGPERPIKAGSAGGGETKEAKHALDDYIRSLQEENSLIRLNARDRAIAEKVLKAENAARRDGKRLTDEQRAQVERLAAAQYDSAEAAKEAEKASRKAAEAQREMWRPVEHAFERIQDAFADMLMEGKFTAHSLTDIFKRAASEIASALIFRPIIAGITGSLTGVSAGGAVPGVAGSVTGGGGSLLSLSGLSNIGSGLLNGFTTPVISPGVAYGIGNTLGLSGGTVGALHQGIANFTPLAGLASLGGGMLANLMGLGGKYSTVTGGIGGLAGTFLGGPIGGAIGSFLGSALGGLGGRPHPGASFDAMFNSGGLAGSPIVLAKHMSGDAAGQAAQSLGGFLQGLSAVSGAKFNTTQVQGVYDPGGAFLRIPGRTGVAFNPNDATSTAQAFRYVALYMARTAKVVDQDLVQALERVQVQGKDASAVLASVSASLSFIKGLREFRDALGRDPSTSNASPEEQLRMARDYFADVAAKAAAGQAGANDVQAAALAYLQASQAYAGRASGTYAADLAGVQNRLTSLTATPPRFAQGGDFAPGTFIVHPGETVMTSRTPGRVLNARETQQAVSGPAQEMARYRAQSAQETMLLVDELRQMKAMFSTLVTALRRVAVA